MTSSQETTWDEVVGRGRGGQIEAVIGLVLEELTGAESACTWDLIDLAVERVDVAEKTVKNQLSRLRKHGLIWHTVGPRRARTGRIGLTVLGRERLAPLISAGSEPA